MAPHFYPLTHLQTIDDEEAKTIVENEQLILAIRSSIESGYWNVTKDRRTWKVRKHQLYRLTKDLCSFQSRIAAAIFISRRLGNLVCRAISENFPEESESQILTNLRIPGIIHTEITVHSKNTWRSKCEALFNSTKAHTKKRNSRGRKHSEVEWNLVELRIWVANELEKSGFRCNYSGLKLTTENVSIERLDENKGYSSTNCVLIDIHFQVGNKFVNIQWTHDKVQSVHHLRKKEIQMDFGLEFFKKLDCMVDGCNSRTKQRNHSPSEVTTEKLIHEYVKQDGRCELLTVPLVLKGKWQMSVERLDESKGYIDDNWVLTVLETQNGHAQWTKEFVESLWGPYSHPNPQLSVSEEDLIDKYNSYKNRSGYAISTRNRWTDEDITVLKEVIEKYGHRPVPLEKWKEILPNRTVKACQHIYLKLIGARDPMNCHVIRRHLKGGIIKSGNKWVVRVRAKQVGRFDSKEEAENFKREYIETLYLKSLSAV